MGLEIDHHFRKHSSLGGTRFGATKRVAAMLSAAVNDASATADYITLFDFRSMFVLMVEPGFFLSLLSIEFWPVS